MNDYDFGKYYRRNNQQPVSQQSGNTEMHKFYRKISLVIVGGLILFFAGLMTGISFQNKKLVSADLKNNAQNDENQEVVNSADIGHNHDAKKSQNHSVSTSGQSDEQDQNNSTNAKQLIKKTLMNPENEFIILAKKYNDGSKDRALYYAGVLNKITREDNLQVVPSIRGKNIKLYVGPMKGKQMAEKMLAKVKSIPEFANSAILYKK